MILLNGLTVVIGLIIFHSALGMTLRANATTRVPFYRNAQIVPVGTVVLRVTGASLLVLGAVLLSTSAWYWPFIVVLAGPIAALIVITIHNRKIANQSAAHNASAQ